MQFRRHLIERLIKELPANEARTAFRRLLPTSLELEYYEQFQWAHAIRKREREFQAQRKRNKEETN